MRARPFHQVDVFSAIPYRGNPLAVVADAAGLDSAQMQAFAAWTNLSETTFLLSPDDPAADYRVRIFTPTAELPFAGHPTLGSAAVWLAVGGEPRGADLVQECALGLISIRRDGERLAFDAPPLRRYQPLNDAERQAVAAGLGLDPADVLDACWLVNGPAWVGIRLVDAAAVLALRPSGPALAGWEVGVVGPHPPGAEAAVEVRAFIGGDSLVEDPVTGSLNAGLARWLIDTGQLPDRYVAAQGTALGRQGRVHVRADGDRLWIGGAVTRAVEGTVAL